MKSLSHRLRSDAVLDRAFVWLCRQRRRWPDADDVWSFRRDWPEEKRRLQAELREGRFQIGLQTRVARQNGEEIDLWSARDALVLKALALVLGDHLSISPGCVHVKGHCGARRPFGGSRDDCPRHRSCSRRTWPATTPRSTT